MRTILSRLLQCTWLLALVAGCAPRPPTLHIVDVADRTLGAGTRVASIAVEPQAGVRPVVRALDRAQDRIFVEAYILSDPRIIRALERAAAQGVAVYVMLDPRPYGLGQAQPLTVAERLRAAGVRVRWSRPGFTYTHAKMIVLDDRLLIVSTANLSRSGFSRNREFLLWDTVHSDVLAASEVFRADWDRLPARVYDRNVALSPVNARLKLAALLETARTRVDVYAEEMADPAMEHLLAHLVRRGIRVRVLLPPGPSAGAGWLAAHGIQVRRLSAPYCHAKAMIVDNREAFVGSENLSTTSLDNNREFGILVHGPVVTALDRVFMHDWMHHG